MEISVQTLNSASFRKITGCRRTFLGLGVKEEKVLTAWMNLSYVCVCMCVCVGRLVLICADLLSGMFLLALGMWACPGWRRCTSSTPASPTPSISIPYLGTLRSSTPPFSGQRSVGLEMLFRRGSAIYIKQLPLPFLLQAIIMATPTNLANLCTNCFGKELHYEMCKWACASGRVPCAY